MKTGKTLVVTPLGVPASIASAAFRHGVMMVMTTVVPMMAAVMVMMLWGGIGGAGGLTTLTFAVALETPW